MLPVTSHNSLASSIKQKWGRGHLPHVTAQQAIQPRAGAAKLQLARGQQ